MKNQRSASGKGIPWDGELAAFRAHISAERNLSRNTVDAYCRDLDRFVVSMLRMGVRTAARVSRKDVYSWLEELGSDRISGRSAARALSTIRTFFKFIAGELEIAVDPTSEIQSPKVARALPRSPEYAQVEAFLSAVDLSRPAGLRDRAILEVLYGSGLRVSEVIMLRLADISIADGTLRVFGKGRKERIVPLGRTAIEWLGRYVRDVRSGFLGRRVDTGVLFLNQKGGALSRQAVWLMVKASAKKAKMRLSPHSLRHAFATHLVEGDVDLRSVQEMLGHASIVTTQIYTSVSRRKLKEVHRKYHPRS